MIGLLACLPMVYQVTYARSTNHVLMLQNGQLEWDAQTQVVNGVAQLTLFDEAYQHVQANQAVVAPGTNGLNTIELVNQQGMTAQYRVIAYVHNPESIPVQVSLSEANDDSSNLPTFIQPSQVVGISSGWLRKGDSHQLELRWDWPFEQDDEQDTKLGSAIKPAQLKVSLYVTMSYEDRHIQAGPNTSVAFMWKGYLLLLVMSGLIWLWLIKKEKKDA